MPQITGIRNDGHRTLITITGPRGAITVHRRPHPECPRCDTTQQTAPTATPAQPARLARRRKPTNH